MSNWMYRAQLVFILAVITLSEVGAYRLVDTYRGASLLNGFHFDQQKANRIYTTFVDRETALREGLFRITPDSKVRLGVDTTGIASGSGRKSVQIGSNKSWTHGLFVMRLSHGPTACGHWGTWWMMGPSNPLNGEIDIIEGANNVEQNLMTLHTAYSCDANNDNFTGDWARGRGGPATNCWWNAPNQFENQGCSIYGGPYGKRLNAMRGGVYAMEWTSTFFRVFFFPHDRVPADLQSDHPTPDRWGRPLANFPLKEECRRRNNAIRDMRMMINIAFCGDFAGTQFRSQCPGLGSCNNFVQYHPEAFRETYWLIDSIKVYQ